MASYVRAKALKIHFSLSNRRTAGPRGVLPNVLLWTLLGAVGQKAVNEYQQQIENSPMSENKKSWFDSKWSPIRKMSDEEYHRYLQEKILGIEAEIAIIDDHIRDLRASKKEDVTESHTPTRSQDPST